MSDFEPGDTMVEALRSANPVPAARTVGRRDLPSAHALFAEIIAEPPRRVRSRVRRRVLVVAIAIIVIALLAAAFALTRRQKSTVPLNISCYSGPSLGARSIVVSSNGNPERACAQVWASHQFGEHASVPDFDVCVLKSGVLGVFPGESGSVCPRLGRPGQSGSNSSAGFAGALSAQFNAHSGCISRDAAEKLVRDDLAQRGLNGWQILRSPYAFSASKPCASVLIDVPARTVTIVPITKGFFAPPPARAP
jgi:hypothetical protein